MSEQGEAEPSGDDDRVAAWVAAARPEVDRYLRDVLRARASAALFGSAPAVAVGRYELRGHIGAGGGGSVFEAWDPELARPVALKLVAAADPGLRSRAVAEGQVLARLSHPNVVPVFDVGVIEDRIYLVMELVRGASLRSYARTARPRDIVAAYRQCAHGLAAAHAVQLVHRDFKPDNAIMGSDGRVRVIDFGLALDEGGAAAPAGTPRYMAPEQVRGEPVTAAADQYALAAALREALVPAPSWLDRVVARALAEAPGDRFGSMAALAAALGRDPATRWRRRAWIALPIAVAVAGYAVGSSRETGPAPCDGAAELAAVWTPARSAAAAAHVTALGTPYARLTAARLAAAVDDHAARWIAAHRSGCLAHQRGALSAALYDRRQICLTRARSELAAVLELADRAGAAQLDSVIRALPELADPAGCDDLDALSAVAPPEPSRVTGAAALRARLDRARVRVHAGADDLEAELVAVVGDARALGYRPLTAEALLAQGTWYLQRWQFAEAEPPLRAAHDEALRSRDYRGAVEAFARLIWVVAKRPDRPPLAALDGLAQIGPLADGLPARDRFAQSLLHNNIGSVVLAAGDEERARAEFETALALARGVSGPGAIELTAALHGRALVTADPRRSAELFAQRIAVLVAALGEAHPITLRARIAAAQALTDPAAARPALAAPCHRLAELHPTHAAAIGECAFELGSLELQLAGPADARDSFALAARAAEPGSYYREVAAAYLALVSGNPDAAIAPLRAQLADIRIDDTTPWHARFDAARLALGLGLAHDAARRRGEAREAFVRARAHLDAAQAVHRWGAMAWRRAWLDRLLAPAAASPR